MGYTHYWDITVKELDQENWNRCIEDCKTLYKNMPEHSTSAGGYYTDSPLKLNGCSLRKNAVFNKNIICFNGTNGCERKRYTFADGTRGWTDVDDSHNLDHETFIIGRRRDKESLFGCCKTARKPYDLMVTACLILLKVYFPKEFFVSSDGDIDDWAEAFKFISDVLHDGKSKTLELLITNPQKKGGLFERANN